MTIFICIPQRSFGAFNGDLGQILLQGLNYNKLPTPPAGSWQPDDERDWQKLRCQLQWHSDSQLSELECLFFSAILLEQTGIIRAKVISRDHLLCAISGGVGLVTTCQGHRKVMSSSEITGNKEHRKLLLHRPLTHRIPSDSTYASIQAECSKKSATPMTSSMFGCSRKTSLRYSRIQKISSRCHIPAR